jgi:hypothetical protein
MAQQGRFIYCVPSRCDAGAQPKHNLCEGIGVHVKRDLAARRRVQLSVRCREHLRQHRLAVLTQRAPPDDKRAAAHHQAHHLVRRRVQLRQKLAALLELPLDALPTRGVRHRPET